MCAGYLAGNTVSFSWTRILESKWKLPNSTLARRRAKLSRRADTISTVCCFLKSSQKSKDTLKLHFSNQSTYGKLVIAVIWLVTWYTAGSVIPVSVNWIRFAWMIGIQHVCYRNAHLHPKDNRAATSQPGNTTSTDEARAWYDGVCLSVRSVHANSRAMTFKWYRSPSGRQNPSDWRAPTCLSCVGVCVCSSPFSFPPPL